MTAGRKGTVAKSPTTKRPADANHPEPRAGEIAATDDWADDLLEAFPRGLGGGRVRTPRPHTPDFGVWLQADWTLAEGVLLVHSINPSTFDDPALAIRGPEPSQWPPPPDRALQFMVEVGQRLLLPGAERVAFSDGAENPAFAADPSDAAAAASEMLLFTTTANSVLTVYDSALKAVSKGTLRPDAPPIGPHAADPGLWLFKPRTFLVWAVTRGGMAFDLPAELAAFVRPGAPAPGLPAGQVPPKRRNPGRAEAWASKREKVLGAAVAVMATQPRCRKGGEWIAEQIVLAIEDKSPWLWPEDEEPPLSHEECRRLISDWLNKLPAVGD